MKAHSSTRARAYIDAAIDGILADLRNAPHGGRNHALNVAAFSLGRLIGAGALDAAIAVQWLNEGARIIGLDGDEARATIRSGRVGLTRTLRRARVWCTSLLGLRARSLGDATGRRADRRPRASPTNALPTWDRKERHGRSPTSGVPDRGQGPAARTRAGLRSRVPRCQSTLTTCQ